MRDPVTICKVGANQPTFLPWVGYWHRLISSDVYVDMPNSQYEKGDFYNRVTVDGHWMTVPVKAPGGAPFSQVRFDRRALPKMAKTLQQAYARAPYASRIAPVIEALLESQTDLLVELNIALRGAVAGVLGVDLSTKVRVAIDVPGDTTDSRLWGMLFTTVPEMTEYLSGGAGRGYLQVPTPVPTKIQAARNPYGGNSVLQLIVHEEDMLGAIAASCVWESL